MNNNEQPLLSLYDTLRNVIDSELRNVHTGIPGKIISYNNSTKLAVVQPTVKYRGKDGSLLSMPKIYDVPVKQYCTNNTGVLLPIKQNDCVWLAFSEKAIDTWNSLNGNEADPGDDRKFDLTDAVAFIGLYPSGGGLQQVNNDDVAIVNGMTVITLKPSGNIELGSTVQFLMTSDAFTDINNALISVASYINGIAPGTVVWPGTHVATSITTKVKAQ
jgi:hypothetical protein